MLERLSTFKWSCNFVPTQGACLTVLLGSGNPVNIMWTANIPKYSISIFGFLVSYHFSFYINSLSPCTPINIFIKIVWMFPSCRHYILDLMRVTPRDSNYMGQEHRFCVLRPELVASFVEVSSSHALLTLFVKLLHGLICGNL